MTGAGPGPGTGIALGTAPECHDDVCAACSDQDVPFRIRALPPGGPALIDIDTDTDTDSDSDTDSDTGTGPETISVALVDAAPGDVVLVHAKEAIARASRRPGAERFDDVAVLPARTAA